jgi:hypothetical protein
VSLVVLDTDAASALLRRRDIAHLTTLLAGHVVADTFVTFDGWSRAFRATFCSSQVEGSVVAPDG